MKKARAQRDHQGKALPTVHCSVCGYTMDAATQADGNHRPRPGDFTICLKCGEVYQYAADMTLADVSLKNLAELPPEQHALIAKGQALIRRNRPIK